MSFACLWIPPSPTGAAESASPSRGGAGAPAESHERLVSALLAIAPHVLADARGVIWVDGRGLPAGRVGEAVLAMARDHGARAARVGHARSAIVAELAARAGGVPLLIVSPGEERALLAPHSIATLAAAAPLPPSPRLRAALADVGIERCGELAALTLEEIEVRFGAEGVALWRLARGEDQRRVFAPRSRTIPSASLSWEEYALRDLERLAFVVNRLAGTVCAELAAWGEGARGMTLTLTLTDGTTVERPARSSRGTASRAAWVRLLRAELERTPIRGAVTALALRVDTAGVAAAPQGDLFDRGFQTARAVEEALTRLLDDGQATIVGLTTTEHPRPERRARWQTRDLGEVLREPTLSGEPNALTPARAPALSLQLLPQPRALAMTVAERRDHQVPARWRERMKGDRADAEVITALGPDRISGGGEIGEPYARDYFQCVTAEGMLALVYHDLLAGEWYLHGWWD